MATAVASLSLPHADNPAEARKRRREILASQRINAATPDVSSSSAAAASASAVGECPASKKQKVEASLPALVSPSTPAKKFIGDIECTTTSSSDEAMATSAKAGGKAKKPQMKYDPDVPMTKEEAAVWRREQRRKRNRESAAASRQRQRDRIVELEEEVEEWKVKFEEAMNRIRQLEEDAGVVSTGTTHSSSLLEEGTHNHEEELSGDYSDEVMDIHSPEALVEEVFKETTILVSPSHSPRSVSPNITSPLDFSQVQAVKVVSNVGANSSSKKNVVSMKEQEEEEPQPSKMISRPA